MKTISDLKEGHAVYYIDDNLELRKSYIKSIQGIYIITDMHTFNKMNVSNDSIHIGVKDANIVYINEFHALDALIKKLQAEIRKTINYRNNLLIDLDNFNQRVLDLTIKKLTVKENGKE